MGDLKSDSTRVIIKSEQCEITFEHSSCSDHIARSQAKTSDFYERDLLDAIRKYHRQGVYVDVGAHVGNHSVFFGLFCPSSLVVSIEGSLDTAFLLRRNLDHNLRSVSFRIHNVIVGAVGERRLMRRKNISNTGMDTAELGSDGSPVSTLDYLTAGLKVAVVKIDVEGSEPSVLLGATSLLGARPLLAIEASTESALRTQEQILRPFGYLRSPHRFCKTPTYIWNCK